MTVVIHNTNEKVKLPFLKPNIHSWMRQEGVKNWIKVYTNQPSITTMAQT